MPDFSTIDEMLDYYQLPFTAREDQKKNCLDLCFFDRVGLFDEVGTGKTCVATMIGFAWDLPHNIVLAPPLVIPQWVRWLRSIKNAGPVLEFVGSPAERAAMDLVGHRWVVMTIQIFKKEFRRIRNELYGKAAALIVDEAHCLKNYRSQNHKKVAEFVNLGHDRKLSMLSATPTSSPPDAFAFIELKTPGLYRSYTQFENLHVGARDFFDNVTEWRGLDIVKRNLMLQSSRRLKNEVLKHLHRPNYILFDYDLEPAHLKLYNQLMATQLLELPDGGKIDATAGSAMYSKSQQLVCNWDVFAGDPSKRSAIYDYIDYTIEETGCLSKENSKLMIFTYFKMTSRAVVAYLRSKGYKVAACYSEVSSTDQRKGIEAFMNDPDTRFLVAQPASAGYGLNAQEVCSETMVLEIPTSPQHVVQLVGRTYREGQKNVPNIRLCVANDTIQWKLYESLLKNDGLVYQVQGGVEALRDAIHGKVDREALRGQNVQLLQG